MLRIFGAALAALLAFEAPTLARPIVADEADPHHIPFTPGGTNDFLARTAWPEASRGAGAAVIVDNRPGGNTVIASQALLAPTRTGTRCCCRELARGGAAPDEGRRCRSIRSRISSRWRRWRARASSWW
jgi:hypothetical protein